MLVGRNIFPKLLVDFVDDSWDPAGDLIVHKVDFFTELICQLFILVKNHDFGVELVDLWGRGDTIISFLFT